MTVEEIAKRIAELEALIAPFNKELAGLKRKFAAIKAGQASAEARRKKAEKRDARIVLQLESNISDLYKRPGGLVRRLAKEEGLSERTIGKLRKISDTK